MFSIKRQCGAHKLRFLGLGIHLFVKVPRPGDSEVTFLVFESSIDTGSIQVA